MQLQYSKDELLSEHDYAEPHVINGRRLHGGFDSNGDYIPPRSKLRPQAIANWTRQLQKHGGDLLDADSSLLTGVRFPNTDQQKFLIQHHLGQTFWNSLTITGKIEARGKMLAEVPFPNLQDFIVEDISDMAIGHLNQGLLIAHGIDEGGEPDKGIGGHDQMWFIARDLVFGENAYEDAQPPAGISREDAGQRTMPEISQAAEQYLSFLMNLLLIEFRAELGFASAQQVMRAEGLFSNRQKQAQEAAEIIERIRTDERIHVESLRLYLGEMRRLHFKSERSPVLGAQFIDRFWGSLVHWATVQSPKLNAERSYEAMTSLVRSAEDGDSLLAQFNDLNPAVAALVQH